MVDSKVQIPSDIIAILEDSHGEELWNTRYERALKTALEQKLDREIVRQIVLYFSSASFNLADQFSWLDILEQAGYDKETLRELLLDRFEVEDPNCNLPNIRRGEFLRYPPAWRLAEPDQMIKFVERMIEVNAGDVLNLNVELAVKIGQQEADRLAGLACQFVQRLTTNAIKTLEHLPPQRRLEVATNLARSTFQHSTFLRQVDELGFLVRAAVEFIDSGKGGEFLLSALSHSVKNPWKFGESKERNSEPERPIVAYRWILKALRNPKLPHERWMDSCETTPEKVGQRRAEEIDKVLRKVLEEAGFCFARVRGIREQDQLQFQAVVADGWWQIVFIEPFQGPRFDIVRDGTEVIVPRCPTENTLFERGRVCGYLHYMHPAEPPTSEMEEAIKQNHNCF